MSIEQDFREILWATEQVRKQQLQPYFQSIGLTAGQPRVLTMLHKKDRVTQRELADACRFDTANLSRILDKLEYLGYLARENNPTCRRSFLVCLTEKGREKAKEVGKGFQIVDAKILSGFTEEEKKRLLGDMQKVYENLKD